MAARPSVSRGTKRLSAELDPGRRKRARSSAPSSRVNVAVRVRPANSREASASTVVQVVDDRCLVFDPQEEAEPFYFKGQQLSCGGLNRANKNLNFLFDKVFDDSKDNVFVFENTTKEMLGTLLDGCNCSVFAYGATGSGKTYTMLGAEDQPGVVWHTVRELYSRVESLRGDGQSCEVTVAYLEVYNEKLRDLLRPCSPTDRVPPLVLGEDPSKGVVVSHLTYHKVAEADSLLELLHKGNLNRTQHPTDANSESSRSHAIFQVYVTQTECLSGTSKQVRRSKMSFVDLAGSERSAAVNRNIGARLREGTNINLSLLALGNVIDALANNKLVCYRQSKLTHLLKDSLGGSCRTLMIANVSPSSLSYHNTHNTLKYAERAMKIQLQAKKNIVNVRCHLTMYAGLLEDSKKKVDSLTAKLQASETELQALKEKAARLEAQLSSRPDSLAPAKAEVEAISMGTPEAPSPVRPSKHAGCAKYFVEAAEKVFAARNALVEQLCDCEAGLRLNTLKTHWRRQVLWAHGVLAGELDGVPEAERADPFLSAERGRRQQLLGQKEDLKNRLRRSFEDFEDLARQAKDARCWEAVELEVSRLERELALSERACWASKYRQLCETQAQHCAHWDTLNNLALPHLRQLYSILEGRNFMCNDLRGTYQGIIKRVKGQCVRWADEQVEREGASLDIGRLLDVPTWHQPESVVATGKDEDCAGYAGDATVVRFPLGSPHPKRSSATPHTPTILDSVDLNATFDSRPDKCSTLESTFVMHGGSKAAPSYTFAPGPSFAPDYRSQRTVSFVQPTVRFPSSSKENALSNAYLPIRGVGRSRSRGHWPTPVHTGRMRKSISTPDVNRALMHTPDWAGAASAARRAEAAAKARGTGAASAATKGFRTSQFRQ
ncbi:kinesin-like protein KIF18A [Ixodes scapularis]